MKVIHGRKGEPEEYLEIKLEKPRVNVTAQKSGDHWVLYIVWPGKDAPVRTVSTYQSSEDARFALDVAALTLSKYV